MALTNETVLVTGASRGIGRAVATHLGALGATVVGTATSDTGARGISNAIREAGHKGQGMVLDVTQSESIKMLFDRLVETNLAPTVLVNNAGITRDNLLVRMRDEEWAEVIDTNLSSLYRMTRMCARSMMKARHGRIINITSVVGAMGNAGQVNYAAAKAGIMGFTKALARELGPRGVTVNAVAPGFIDTDMTRSLSEDTREALIKQIPLQRLGVAEDIAYAVGFLAGPHAAYVTGTTLHVNGGMYMA